MKTVPEPHAALISADEIEADVASLTASLERRQAERRAYEILGRPNIRTMLNQLIEQGICADEGEAIEQALKAFLAEGPSS